MTDLFPSAPVFAAYVAAVVVLTLTPGPDMTLFLSKTVSQSRRAGFAAYAGAATGLLFHSIFVAVGLSALLLASATAFMALKIAGAIYLLWLAYSAVRSGSAFELQGGNGRQRIASVYASGLGINLLNPKIIVFFLTFLPQFVDPSDPDAPAKLFVLGILFVLIATPFTAAMIVGAGAMARVLKRSRRLRRLMDWLFALVLGGFAVKLLATRASG